jgi:glycosyltransferase involved in cell wall biosynthesis
MKTINVLISTYNGEKFLEEQLLSIRNQIGVNTKIFVRDDGSTDKTRDVLEKLLKMKVIEKVYYSNNIGYALSFLYLLRTHSSECDFIAFSDQDDVWDPDKLLSAIKYFDKKTNEPQLYFSAMKIVNENLEETGIKHFYNKITFGAAFSRHNAAGCTMVFNPRLADLANKITLTDNLISHDSFVYILCLWCAGTIFYDDKPRINYRQHEKNVTGFKQKTSKRLKNELFNNRKPQKKRMLLTRIFQEKYSEFGSNDNWSLLNKYLSYLNKEIGRHHLIFDRRLKFGRMIIDFYNNILILFRIF